MKKPTHLDPLLGPLTDDALTREYRVWQRLGGHRFSSDDMATAWVAYGAAPDARRVLDLGTGLGSVLLQLAWRMPAAQLVGVEAQELSFELLRRNVTRNGLETRVTTWHGDLRAPELIARLGVDFPLITGTPPYFPPDTAVDALDTQRAYARIEYRGGVEAYVATAAQLLAPEGVLVLCGESRSGGRVTTAATTGALRVDARCDIIPFEGRPPLFSIWTLRRVRARPAPTTSSTLTLRDAAGRPTAEANQLRAFSGFGPAP